MKNLFFVLIFGINLVIMFHLLWEIYEKNASNLKLHYNCILIGHYEFIHIL